jgi:predicted metal-binding membrane protein
MALEKPSGAKQWSILSQLNNALNNDVLLLWGVVFLAWVLTLVATATGQEHWLHYDALIEHHSLSLPLKLLILVAAWQVMTAAMMLPSTLPMVRLFAKASRGQSQPRLALLTFLLAYALIWTGFALLSFIGDISLHSLMARSSWLHHHPWMIAGSTLVLAGGFQFSSLKEQCLNVCRHPFSFLTHHYQRGLQAAWNLGIRHGLYCLGCCWALMLVMFAVGVGHFAWMIGLTVVMTLERTWKRGREIVPVVGLAFLVWGVLVLFHPSWLPDWLAGYTGTQS